MKVELGKTTLFSEAGKARRRIEQAAKIKSPDRFIVSPEITACMLGIKAETFLGHTSVLIQPEEGNVYFIIGEKKIIAETAIARWQKSRDEDSSIAFREQQYHRLFLLFQKAYATKRAQNLAKGIHGVFLETTAQERPRLKGLKDVIAKNGSIPDGDLHLVQETMGELWDGIPKELKRSTLSGLNPENIFQSS